MPSANTSFRNPALALTLTLLLCAAPGMMAEAQDIPVSRKAVGRPPRLVIVSLPDRKLAVVAGGQVLRVFPVSVGASYSPSPVGTFTITSRIANPTYYHTGVVIPAGPENPLGPRWLGINKKSYGIHGTNAPGSIGKAASHGCIRLRNRDVVELYSMLAVGDVVEIHGQRDARTLRIFGNPTPQHALVLARLSAKSSGQ
jgi:lipoprotein-anchoring transpeptidase ErfK/SrfK